MSETDSSTIGRVKSLVMPILTDLKLDLYDLEYRGGVVRVTIDRPAVAAPVEGVDESAEEGAKGVEASPQGGLDLEMIALATRLISRELDHEDPVPGHYTLEVSSPGLERVLRTPEHFARSIGATVAVRMRDIGEGGERRVHGVLEASDDATITVRTEDGSTRTIPYTHIDRAKTVFVWGPTPKPGATKKKERQA
jgi:ribosome maturation factor RimP